MQAQEEDYFEEQQYSIPVNYEGAPVGIRESPVDSSDVFRQQSSDGGTPTPRVNTGPSERKKEKKSKKEKKAKKDKKKRKKAKANRATEKLLEGDMESELDVDFDQFVTNRETIALSDAQAAWEAQQLANHNWAQADGCQVDFTSHDDGIGQTPRTTSTSTTMSSRGSLCLDNMKPMLDAIPSPAGSKSIVSNKSNGSDTSSQKSGKSNNCQFKHDMLQNFLKQHGQDEKLALATAMAFGSFLIEQQNNGVDITNSRESSSHTETDNDDVDEEESDEDDGMKFEAYNHSDVSTLGWSCAEATSFGSSWSDDKFVTKAGVQEQIGPGSANNGENDRGFVRQNESFVARHSITAGPAPADFWGGGRRVPNRVATAQGRTVHQSLKKSLSESFGHTRAAEERSFEQQMASLTIEERDVVTSLKTRWLKSGKPPFPNMWYLKFARCSPGRPFTFNSAYKSMKKYNQQYMNLTIIMMEAQLRIKMLFPVPGLKSIKGHSMFYMRPSRYFPKRMSTSSVINNLIYVMDCMLEREESQRDGIGFVANMEGWTMSNFQVNYCYKFMMGLQAKKTPTRVQLFLIVNPPAWFGNIWSIMKSMLSDEFRKKVHIINHDGLKKYLVPGYEKLLPDDIIYGEQDTEKMVKDFIVERRQLESSRMLSSEGSIH